MLFIVTAYLKRGIKITLIDANYLKRKILFNMLRVRVTAIFVCVDTIICSFFWTTASDLVYLIEYKIFTFSVKIIILLRVFLNDPPILLGNCLTQGKE